MRSDIFLVLRQKVSGETAELRELGARRRAASISLPVVHRTGPGHRRLESLVVELEPRRRQSKVRAG